MSLKNLKPSPNTLNVPVRGKHSVRVTITSSETIDFNKLVVTSDRRDYVKIAGKFQDPENLFEIWVNVELDEDCPISTPLVLNVSDGVDTTAVTLNLTREIFEAERIIPDHLPLDGCRHTVTIRGENLNHDMEPVFLPRGTGLAEVVGRPRTLLNTGLQITVLTARTPGLKSELKLRLDSPNGGATIPLKLRIHSLDAWRYYDGFWKFMALLFMIAGVVIFLCSMDQNLLKYNMVSFWTAVAAGTSLILLGLRFHRWRFGVKILSNGTLWLALAVVVTIISALKSTP